MRELHSNGAIGYISIVKTGSKEQKNKMQGVGIMNKKEIKLSNGMEMPRLGMGTGFLEKTGAKTRKRQWHSEQELMREYD